MRDSGQRFREERHLAIGTRKLQVSPGTERLDGGILTHGNESTSGKKRGVAMGYVVVAVVDDTIVDIGRVVLVGGVGREVCQTTQVVVGKLGCLDKVSAHLAYVHILVGKLLHGLHHTEGKVNGVGLAVKLLVEELA